MCLIIPDLGHTELTKDFHVSIALSCQAFQKASFSEGEHCCFDSARVTGLDVQSVNMSTCEFWCCEMNIILKHVGTHGDCAVCIHMCLKNQEEEKSHPCPDIHESLVCLCYAKTSLPL